jgi:hypothetical protein
MKKTVGILITLILLISAGTYFYIKSREVVSSNLFEAIPTNAGFFIDIHDITNVKEEFSESNSLWNEILQISSLKNFREEINLLDSLVNFNNKDIQNALNNKNLIISAHESGKNNLEFLFIMKYGDIKEKKLIEQYLKKYINHKSLSLESRDYNQTKLYTASNEKPKLNYAFSKGTFICSRSGILVEKGIRQLTVDKSFKNDTTFRSIKETSGKNVPANIYINFQNLTPSITSVFKPAHKQWIKNLRQFSEWTALDVNPKKNALLFNGFTKNSKSDNYYASLFKNQEPVKLDIEDILPSQTATFIDLGISNNSVFFKDYKNILENSQKLASRERKLETLKTKYKIDFEKTFRNLIHEEIGLVYLNAPSEDPSRKGFVAIKTKGKRHAKEIMESLSKKVTSQTNKWPYKKNIQIDKESTFNLYKLPIDNLFGTLLGGMFSHINNDYFTILDNFVIFGSTPDLLKEFLYSNVLNKTLSNNHNYKDFNNYLSDKANFHFYTSMSRSPFLIADFLDHKIEKGISENLNQIRKFQAFAYQFMNSGEMLYNNMFLNYIPTVSEDPKTVWETHLDTTLNFKPALVENHYTGENEIFVQDMNQNLYLINKVGRILWKKRIEENIIGDIHQIDFYNNGKLQILFNTKNKIHLVDRKGNYVENYPITLPSPATAPLAVFDYNNNSNYRIFIPCENKKVYDFSKEGRIIEGWKFGKSDTKVTTPVQHFRIGTKDYIVFADKYRIYILNRRGETRVETEKQFSKSKENIFYISNENSSNPSLVTTNKKGTVHHIYFDGQIKTTNAGEFTENHFFDLKDMNSDDKKDFIFLDENTLHVIEQNGKEIFKRKFKHDITYPPIYFYFSYNKRKLGIVSKNSNKIYLVNSDGSIYKGFPLQGSTPFSIGFLDKPARHFNLLVGNKYNFLYNYAVN